MQLPAELAGGQLLSFWGRTGMEVQANGLLLRGAEGKGQVTPHGLFIGLRVWIWLALPQLVLTESSWPPFLAVAQRQPVTLDDIMKMPEQ